MQLFKSRLLNFREKTRFVSVNKQNQPLRVEPPDVGSIPTRRTQTPAAVPALEAALTAVCVHEPRAEAAQVTPVHALLYGSRHKV